MGITKTIGGDRLGSGNKMKQTLHPYDRSTHDLSRVWRSTMQVGVLTPCFVEYLENGDTFDINISHKLLTAPTNGPTFAAFKTQIDMFFAPIRLYNGLLHNNPVAVGMNMDKVLFPTMALHAAYIPKKDCEALKIDYDTHQISPSSLLAYTGLRGIGSTRSVADEKNENPTMVGMYKQCMNVLAYYDIFKQYYSNKQESKAYVIAPNQREQVTTGDIIEIGVGGRLLSLVNDKGEKFPNKISGVKWKNITDIDSFETNTWYSIKSKSVVGQYDMPCDEKFVERIFFNLVYKPTTSNIYGFSINVTDLASELLIFPNEGYFSFRFNENKAASIVCKETKTNGVPPHAFEFEFEEGFVTTGYYWGQNKTNLLQFDLENIDKMRRILLRQELGESIDISADSIKMLPYSVNFENVKNFAIQKILPNGRTLLAAEDLCGLVVKTYQSDLFNNWLGNDFIEGSNGISAITDIDVSLGMLSLDVFNIKKKTYNILNRVILSGGTYEDWQEAGFGVEAVRRMENPIYLGGQSSKLIFDEVISTGGSEPLGTLAGRGVSIDHKDGKIYIKADEPGILMGIASITPYIDYSQGNKWWTDLTNPGQLHLPGYDCIGYQNLPTWQMAWWDTRLNANGSTITGGGVRYSAGKQPSWIHYQTAVNESFGAFARENEMMFMTLNRRYEKTTDTNGESPIMGSTIADLTTYIDPSKYNYIFVDQSLQAENFWMQIMFNVEARRIMSANQIPNL